MKKFLTKVISIATALFLVLATGLAHGDSGSSPTNVMVGQPITFVVESPQGAGKITYRRCTTCTQINVANDTAFSHVDVGTTHYLTYVPQAGEVNRDEVFSYSYAVVASGHLVKTVTAYVAYFHVDAVVAP